MKQFDKNRKKKFGDTFLAEEKLSGEKVILKYLNKTNKNSRAYHQMVSEAQFKFENNNLQSSLSFTDEVDDCFLVKEYCDGETLLEFWKGVKKKDKLAQLKVILEKLKTCFDSLNQLNIVHADIKPGNIIVKTNENHEVIDVYLIDFGLAFDKRSLPQRKTLFALGYSSPELILNELELVNYSSDLFSLGIVVYQLIEGKLPLLHANPTITTNLQLLHPLPEVSRKWREFNPILQKLTNKYSFKIPPNRMLPEKRIAYLKQAINNRYSEYSIFLQDVNAISKLKRF